jgi:hypothetical protein
MGIVAKPFDGCTLTLGRTRAPTKGPAVTPPIPPVVMGGHNISGSCVRLKKRGIRLKRRNGGGAASYWRSCLLTVAGMPPATGEPPAALHLCEAINGDSSLDLTKFGRMRGGQRRLRVEKGDGRASRWRRSLLLAVAGKPLAASTHSPPPIGNWIGGGENDLRFHVRGCRWVFVRAGCTDSRPMCSPEIERIPGFV